MSFSVSIKTSTGSKFDISVLPTDLISSLRAKISEIINTPADQLRLIYAGRVLKDNQTITECKIENGHTIHLVKGLAAPSPAASEPRASAAPSAPAPAPAAAAAAAAPAGIPGFGVPTHVDQIGGAAALPDFLAMQNHPMFGNMQRDLMNNPQLVAQMMESPLVQSMLNDPNIMNSIIQNNPQLRALREANPELNAVLNDPEIMRQSMNAMRNPALMQEMMRSHDRQLGNIETMPGGFNALRRMYETVQRPMEEAMVNQAAGMTGGNTANNATPAVDPNNPFASLFGLNGGAAAPEPNNAPLPNPWGGPAAARTAGAGAPAAGAPNPAAAGGMPMFDMQMLQQMFGGGAAGAGAGAGAGAATGAAGQPDAAQQPNPFAALLNNPMFAELLGGGAGAGAGAFGAGAFGAPAAAPAAAPALPPEQQYEAQLRAMSDMGFTDQARNLRALVQTRGNVHLAVERILSEP